MPRPERSELTNSGQYTDETIELALTALASTLNSKQAARIVKDKLGTGPSSETILLWARDRHSARYLAIRENEAEKIKSRVATYVEDLLMDSLEVQRKALGKANGDLEKLDARDSAGALRNIATSAGILATNLREMRPKEPIRIEHELNADDALRKLADILGVSQSVEGTVEDVLTIQASPEHVPTSQDLAQGSGQTDPSEPVSEA